MMKSELLKTFDERHSQTGMESRETVHKLGLWHETFHCWFVCKEVEKTYIYFQIRSHEKKDFPSLLDITAAGHLLAEERVHDGVREIKEELGIQIDMDDLLSLGVIKDTITQDHFIDHELCHVFLYQSGIPFERFHLQKEEVTGIVRAEITAFHEVWFNDSSMLVNGYEIDSNGKRVDISRCVTRESFVPHEDSYMVQVLKSIKERI